MIELLIAISIIALLAAMLLPVLGMANRVSKGTATRSTMAKLDVALRMFRSDVGSYPYQNGFGSYQAKLCGWPWNNTTPTAAVDPPINFNTGSNVSNQLFWNLGTSMTTEQVKSLRNIADAVAKLYNSPFGSSSPFTYNGTLPPATYYGFPYIRPISPSTCFNVPTAPSASDQANSTYGITSDGQAYYMNRMASERAMMAVYAGNIDLRGPQPSYGFPGIGDYESIKIVYPWRLPTGSLITATGMSSPSAPYGWGCDYLLGEVQASSRLGDAILDAWKHPIIYICQVVEGVYSAPSQEGGVKYVNTRLWGLSADRRTTLAACDAMSATPLTANGRFLPDPTKLRCSDRRCYAATQWEGEFELWSAGADGQFDWMRDGSSLSHDVNRDNISLVPYDRALP